MANGSHGAIFSANIQTTSTLLIGANPRRKALVISSPVTNRVTISSDNPAVDRVGITLYAGGPPAVLCSCHVGDWIKGTLFAVADTAAQLVGGVESSAGLDEEV